MASAPYSLPPAAPRPRRVVGFGAPDGVDVGRLRVISCAPPERPSPARRSYKRIRSSLSYQVDDDPSPCPTRRQDDLGAEGLPQAGGHLLQVRVGWAGARRGHGRCPVRGLGADELLGLADGQAPLLDLGEEPLLVRVVGERGEGACVALRDPTGAYGFLHGGGDREQTQGVGDGGARPAHLLRDLLLGQAEVVDEAPEPLRLIHGIEVRALEVLDQGERELVLLVGAANDRGDGRAGRRGRRPAGAAHPR